MSQEIVVTPSGTVARARDLVVPRIIGDAGDRAARRFLEFGAHPKTGAAWWREQSSKRAVLCHCRSLTRRLERRPSSSEDVFQLAIEHARPGLQ